MSKRFFALAFALGLAVLAWVGLGFIGTGWMPRVMTAVIAAVYLLGAWELTQFRAATTGLQGALERLAQPPATLAEWLEQVPATLRGSVRLRIEGERGALPGPALTPYLVGLLVMLGMLGTFLGMVVTFKGAVFALQGSTDLAAMRAALAEPIKGLGLSFGTSVAGVAASAALGLMSALARRERLEVARALDTRAATVLASFSLVHQRQESFKALQVQARVLPQVADSLQAVIERMEQRAEQLDRQLLERHAQFQAEAGRAYTQLAERVSTSLQDNLAAGARAAGDAIQPVVTGAMAQVAQESQRLQARIAEAADGQVQALSQRFEALLHEQAQASREERAAWTQALQATGASLAGTLQASSSSLTDSLQQTAASLAESLQASSNGMTETLRKVGDDLQRQWQRVGDDAMARQQASTQALETAAADHGQRMEQLAGTWREELAALRADEARRAEAALQQLQQLHEGSTQQLATLRAEEAKRGEAAVQRLDTLQAAVTQHLATLGAALEAPITRLLQTAAEVPQAAAGVITQLREEMSRAGERDNLALQERTVLMERLGALLRSVDEATGEQRVAIETLVASSSAVLQQAHERFTQMLDAHAGQAADSAAHVNASAVELASLAEAFGQGVQLFQASSEKLTDTLQRVDASLQRSTARSDEQLAYYVAQAREVIDLSIASQQGLVDNLRQLQVRKAAPAAERSAA